MTAIYQKKVNVSLLARLLEAERKAINSKNVPVQIHYHNAIMVLTDKLQDQYNNTETSIVLLKYSSTGSHIMFNVWNSDSTMWTVNIKPCLMHGFKIVIIGEVKDIDDSTELLTEYFCFDPFEELPTINA